ncbi:MAG TPA: cobalamin-binding protein [Povalibacter sp.]
MRVCIRLAMLLLTLAGTIAEAAPVRIVSLAPNLTELAFSAGAGERIVGTVEYSDYPEAARSIMRIGDAFRIDYEQLVALRPDVVLAWEPGTPSAVIDRVRSLHINVVVIRTYNLAEIGAGVREIGRIAHSESLAMAAATAFETDIAMLRQQFSARPAVDVFLQINDRPLYTVNGKQVMSEVLALCGGRNVFGSLSDLAPQVGVEAVIAANPGAIVSTGDSGPAALDQWRKWPQLRAVAAGNLFSLPADDLSRPTLRLAQGARAMCRTLETARDRLQSEK